MVSADRSLNAVSRFICLASSFHSPGPTGDHAPQCVPTVGENENYVRYDKQNEDPHQPEVPDTSAVKSTEDCGQPGKLHGFMSRPAGQDREQACDRNGKISQPLERVVFGALTGRCPRLSLKDRPWRTGIVGSHLRRAECVAQSWEQGAPSVYLDRGDCGCRHSRLATGQGGHALGSNG